MNTIWDKAKETWETTKNVVSLGISTLEEEVKAIAPVYDLSYTEITHQIKITKKTLENHLITIEILSKTILEASTITLSISKEFSELVYPTDIELKKQTDKFLETSENSNKSFHNLIDKLIPQEITIPISNILIKIEELDSLNKKTHQLLFEKEKIEKQYKNLENSQHNLKIIEYKQKLLQSENNYQISFTELSQKFQNIKNQVLEVQQKSFK